jgi:hypothetical protein
MNKRAKALSQELEVLNGSMLAVELMLARIDNDPKLIKLGQSYLDMLGIVQIAVADKYNKALQGQRGVPPAL